MEGLTKIKKTQQWPSLFNLPMSHGKLEHISDLFLVLLIHLYFLDMFINHLLQIPILGDKLHILCLKFHKLSMKLTIEGNTFADFVH